MGRHMYLRFCFLGLCIQTQSESFEIDFSSSLHTAINSLTPHQWETLILYEMSCYYHSARTRCCSSSNEQFCALEFRFIERVEWVRTFWFDMKWIFHWSSSKQWSLLELLIFLRFFFSLIHFTASPRRGPRVYNFFIALIKWGSHTLIPFSQLSSSPRALELLRLLPHTLINYSTTPKPSC